VHRFHLPDVFSIWDPIFSNIIFNDHAGRELLQALPFRQMDNIVLYNFLQKDSHQ
jgi:hypothetical protein